MDHTSASWKNENVISQLHNSVDNVTEALGRAQTNPTESTIQHVHEAMERAENALSNALQNSEHTEPVERLREQLQRTKEQLRGLQR
ncbi:hypothetical protein [Bacillus thermotolerans]|uniref:DUF2564 family protein n=1 Tax=Bacillus thermotolerans TaxID=1221996 RepID=A0A0F5HQ29_BACTR|nr:hypothetical protein [Bacillus thermotolerans]KKB34942.1 hypothetical protein QY97_02093 [Bacillus thermotolerans]KKB40207.1 hypothetical protein QY95_01840 [Bacillus thermotolerans]KKB43080.1 hypothetical protein QY96_00967 [Bacillus thermotolerans]